MFWLRRERLERQVASPAGSLMPEDCAPLRPRRRRLECCLLLYLDALPALLSLHPHVRDSEGSLLRCQLLQDLLRTPALLPLWRRLLGPSGAAGAGFDPAWVLALTVALCIDVSCRPPCCYCGQLLV